MGNGCVSSLPVEQLQPTQANYRRCLRVLHQHIRRRNKEGGRLVTLIRKTSHDLLQIQCYWIQDYMYIPMDPILETLRNEGFYIDITTHYVYIRWGEEYLDRLRVGRLEPEELANAPLFQHVCNMSNWCVSSLHVEQLQPTQASYRRFLRVLHQHIRRCNGEEGDREFVINRMPHNMLQLQSYWTQEYMYIHMDPILETLRNEGYYIEITTDNVYIRWSEEYLDRLRVGRLEPNELEHAPLPASTNS